MKCLTYCNILKFQFPLMCLPDDVLLKIFGQLKPIQAKLRLGATCHRMRRLMHMKWAWPDEIEIELSDWCDNAQTENKSTGW